MCMTMWLNKYQRPRDRALPAATFATFCVVFPQADPDLNELKKTATGAVFCGFPQKHSNPASVHSEKHLQSFCDPVFRVLSTLPLHKWLEAELKQTKAQNAFLCSTSLQKCLISKLLDALPTLSFVFPLRSSRTEIMQQMVEERNEFIKDDAGPSPRDSFALQCWLHSVDCCVTFRLRQ